MNERRMLHPIFMLLGIAGFFKALLPMFIIVGLRGLDWQLLKEWYWLAGGAAFLVLLSLFSYLQWKKFGFWLEEDRIVIRSGLLFRDEKTIYYSRIHSVNVEQPLLHRLLRVAKLKIETPGGGQKADGVLHVLSLAEAGRIRTALNGFAQASRQKSPAAEPSEGVRHTSEVGEMQLHTEETVSTVSADSLSVNAAADAAQAAAERDAHVRVQDGAADRAVVAASAGRAPAAMMRLDAVKLLQAAATSLNFGLAAAFIAGIYSFADDFIELLLPKGFFDTVVEESISLLPGIGLVIAVVVIVILMAWLLSIVLYVLKYSGFTVSNEDGRISLSYGLLEKKTFLFEPKKVQAVIVGESLLRQPFGYAEIKLQVVSSDKQEQLMLHPFIKRSEIPALLAAFLPQFKQHSEQELAASPSRAFIYYIRVYLLLAVAACIAAIALAGPTGAWSLLIFPFLAWWRIGCHSSAGLLLEDGQLTLRRRIVNRTTCYIRKPQILVMKVRRSTGQRRKRVATLSVHAMGSPLDYKAVCMDQADVETVWKWYSRSRA